MKTVKDCIFEKLILNKKISKNKSTREKIVFDSKDELIQYIIKLLQNYKNNNIDYSYLDLSNIILSKSITNINSLFAYSGDIPRRLFDDIRILDVTDWDVSNITDMSDLFQDCEYLEEIVGIETWNTSKCTDFSAMFMNCDNLFEINIRNFDFSNAIYLSYMFSGCTNLKKIDLSNFNASQSKYINNMFSRCRSIESLDVSNFNLDNCKELKGVFQYCAMLKEIKGLDKWNISNIINLERLFSYCYELNNINISNWDINKCENVSYMFADCKKLKIDLSHWNINRKQVHATYMCVGAKNIRKPKFS